MSVTLLVVGLSMKPSISQEFITGLYSTGVDDTSGVLPSGAVDPHYSLSGPATLARSIDKNTRWVSPPTGSTWIGPSQGYEYDPVGVYVYTLTFDLTGQDVSSAIIWGRWTADNYASVLLNDVDTGVSVGDRDYGRLFDFVIDSGFVTGVNELQFVVNNSPPGDNPTGLLVAELEGVTYPPVLTEVSTWSQIKSLYAR
jgi:hypothetical protein